jgi:hypothetical protein
MLQAIKYFSFGIGPYILVVEFLTIYKNFPHRNTDFWQFSGTK